MNMVFFNYTFNRLTSLYYWQLYFATEMKLIRYNIHNEQSKAMIATGPLVSNDRRMLFLRLFLFLAFLGFSGVS